MNSRSSKTIRGCTKIGLGKRGGIRERPRSRGRLIKVREIHEGASPKRGLETGRLRDSHAGEPPGVAQRVARCSLRSHTFARPFPSVVLVIAGREPIADGETRELPLLCVWERTAPAPSGGHCRCSAGAESARSVGGHCRCSAGKESARSVGGHCRRSHRAKPVSPEGAKPDRSDGAKADGSEGGKSRRLPGSKSRTATREQNQEAPTEPRQTAPKEPKRPAPTEQKQTAPWEPKQTAPEGAGAARSDRARGSAGGLLSPRREERRSFFRMPVNNCASFHHPCRGKRKLARPLKPQALSCLSSGFRKNSRGTAPCVSPVTSKGPHRPNDIARPKDCSPLAGRIPNSLFLPSVSGTPSFVLVIFLSSELFAPRVLFFA